jgi:hypothetical protein
MMKRHHPTLEIHAMRKLPLPAALYEHVADLTDEVALTDAEGRVVAYLFSPDQREMFYDMGAAITDAADPAAARRKVAASPYRTTAAVLAEMRARMAEASGA